MAGRPSEAVLDAWVERARVEARRCRVAVLEADSAAIAQRSVGSARCTVPKRSSSAAGAASAPVKAAGATAAAVAEPRSKRKRTDSLRSPSLSAFATDVVAAIRKALLPFYGSGCAIETKESFKGVCRYLSKKILAKEMAKDDGSGDTTRSFSDATRRRITKYISEKRVAAALAAM